MNDGKQANNAAAGRARLLRSAAGMSAITVASRVLGLIREQVRAHYLGTSMASDAFGLAFQIPNLLRRLVAEGAMSAGFIPVLSDVDERDGRPAAIVFARRYFNFMLLAMVGVSGLGMLGAPVIVAGFALLGGREIPPEAFDLTASLTRWMFPYIAFVALAAVAQGILNTYRVFWVSAASAVVMNAAIIGFSIGLADHTEAPVYAFAIAILIAGVLQFAVQLPHVVRLGFTWKPDFAVGPGVRRALWLLVPTLFGAGVYQVNTLVSQAIAWGLGSGAISSLQYSSRLLELTLGVFAVAISTVVLPSLARDAAAGRLSEVQETTRYAIRLCCIVCLPMFAGLYLLRSETASLLFERGAYSRESTAMTAYALGFHVIGLLHIALGRVFVPVFYAFKDTRTPVAVAVVAMIVNVALCYALAPSLSHGGIALANSVSAIVQATLLAWLMRRLTGRLLDRTTAVSIGKSVAATAAMAGVVFLLAGPLLGGRTGSALLLPYSALVVVAGVVFAGTARLLRHGDLDEIIEIVRRKLRRR